MKLGAAVSPATWILIERLRPELPVTVEVFDANLAPVLPPPDDTEATSWVLRRLASEPAPAGAREEWLTAVTTGRHVRFTHGALRVGVFPIRHQREVIGVLAAAAPGTQAVPAAEPHDLQQDTSGEGLPDAAPDPVDRRIERAACTFRTAIEADIALAERLAAAQHQARWADSLVRFLDYLQRCEHEGELFGALVQAAALWGDVDARVYRRALDGRFVLETALPGREVSSGPVAFEAALLADSSGVVHLGSLAELEQFGWKAHVGEVWLLPIVGPRGTAASPARDALWLLALTGDTDQRLLGLFDVLTRAVRHRIEELINTRADRIINAMRARVAGTPPGIPAAAGLLHELTSGLPCAHARLWREERGGARHVLAAAGGRVLEGDGESAGPAERESDPRRVVLPLRVATDRTLVLELSAGERPLGVEDVLVAERVGAWLEGWLAGALRSSAGEPFAAACPEATAFEQRLADELERARRHGHGLGLLVVHILPPERATSRIVAAVVELVRGHVRATDVTGRLAPNRLGVLLVQADEARVRAVARRVEREVGALLGRVPGTAMRLGLAVYPSDGSTAAALLAAASQAASRAAPV